jgi:glycosyltransferase involved in cell wall biosynthesis
MRKTLSIIIPAFNEERLIGACLDAIATQTDMPDEVIVVDNNSTDRTAEIAESYPFVKVLREKKQGIVYARNAGYDAAKCDIIGRIDADVVIPRGWVWRVRKFYDNPRHEQCGLSGNGRPNNLRFPRMNGWLQGQIAFRVNRLLMGHYIFFGSNMAFPRKIWQQIRPDICLRTDIHEDLDLAVHFHRAGYQITYQETLRVTGRAARLITNRKDLLNNLMFWPRTLRVHYIRTWIFGWIGAVLLYGISVLPWIFERIARLAGRKPLSD